MAGIYFQKEFNYPAVNCNPVVLIGLEVKQKEPTSTQVPTIEEIKVTINKLRNKALGLDQLQSEMLRAYVNTTVSLIHPLI